MDESEIIELMKTIFTLLCWIIGAILFIYNLGWGAFFGLFFLLFLARVKV